MTYKTEINWAGDEILIPRNDSTGMYTWFVSLAQRMNEVLQVPVLPSAPPTQRQGTPSPLRTHPLDSVSLFTNFMLASFLTFPEFGYFYQRQEPKYGEKG